MDLDGSPEGPIRIDRMTPQAFTAVPVSGTVSGARDGARVLLDAYDFDTQELAGNGPWSAQLYTSEIDPPFFVAALEITDGHLTNLATTTIDPRPHTATMNVALAFGATAETPIVSTYTVSGFTPGSHALTAPTAFGLGSTADFSAPFGAIGNGSGDVDALVIHIDEGEDHGPRWRVYCSPSLHTRDNPCNVPALPSSVTLADLGIGISTRPSALVMMQTAHEGSLWSFPGVGFPSSRLDWQLASSYSDFDPNGTFAP